MAEAMRSSSLRAKARFLSVAFDTLMRRCHLRSLYSCARLRVGMLLP